MKICLTIFDFKMKISPGWVAQCVGASCTPKVCEFSPWSGHIPRLRFNPQSKYLQEATNVSFSHWCLSLSLSRSRSRSRSRSFLMLTWGFFFFNCFSKERRGGWERVKHWCERKAPPPVGPQSGIKPTT